LSAAVSSTDARCTRSSRHATSAIAMIGRYGEKNAPSGALPVTAAVRS
jgi:hypothetical protein